MYYTSKVFTWFKTKVESFLIVFYGLYGKKTDNNHSIFFYSNFYPMVTNVQTGNLWTIGTRGYLQFESKTALPPSESLS